MRDLLRNLILSHSETKRASVTIGELTYEVRAPTVAERSSIIKEAGKQDKNGEANIDFAKLQVYAIIHLTVVPGTDEKVFTEADIPTLMSRPANGPFDELAEAAIKVVNVRKEDDVKN